MCFYGMRLGIQIQINLDITNINILDIMNLPDLDESPNHCFFDLF